jgi:hypothetical protein
MYFILFTIFMSYLNSVLCETHHVSEISRYLEIRDNIFLSNRIKEEISINLYDSFHSFEFLPCNVSTHQYPHLAATVTLAFCISLFFYILMYSADTEGTTSAIDDDAPNFEPND